MGSHKDNHGKVGEALYVKMTLKEFQEKAGTQDVIQDKTEISVEELEKYGVCSIPIIIDNSTQGEYEVVCENGVEVHYSGE